MERYIPADLTLEEEATPGYRSHDFHNTHPGDVLNERYKLVAKLGFGTSSTVWMAQDLHLPPTETGYVAVKICTSNVQNESTARHELRISQRIVDCAQGDERKYANILTVHDSFEIPAVRGTHLCLVMDLMREPVWLMRRRLTGCDKASAKTIVLFKLYVINILDGLEYLHDKCKVIHTDLKLDNIMIGHEDEIVAKEFAQAQQTNPMPRKKDQVGRTIYLSHNNFGPLQQTGKTRPFFLMCLNIADFGLAQRGDASNGPLIFPIQNESFHAPEVLLGTGWSYSADIWNLGIMIWNLLAGQDLFRRTRDETGVYSAKHHLAEMISLLGPVPEELIARERSMRKWRWAPECLNAEGKLCNNAVDFFGGPFFDDDGRFVGQDLVTSPQTDLATLAPDCIVDGQEKEDFVDFMKQMLHWLPEERMTASQLQQHPWLMRWQIPPEGWQPAGDPAQ